VARKSADSLPGIPVWIYVKLSAVRELTLQIREDKKEVHLLAKKLSHESTRSNMYKQTCTKEKKNGSKIELKSNLP
jgi:hypothetical protein